MAILTALITAILFGLGAYGFGDLLYRLRKSRQRIEASTAEVRKTSSRDLPGL